MNDVTEWVKLLLWTVFTLGSLGTAMILLWDDRMEAAALWALVCIAGHIMKTLERQVRP